MRIFILDDQPALAGMLAMSLCVAGHAARGFTSATEALADIIKADLLVTHYHLPETTGMEVVRQAYAQGWRGRVIIASGYPTRIKESLEHPLVCMALPKPFIASDLIEAISLIEAEDANPC